MHARTGILQYDVLLDSLFDHLFESLEITPRTLAFGMLLEIVDEFAYHFLSHLIRLDIGLHIGVGFGKEIAEPLQGTLHHADVLFRVGVDIGLEKDEEIDFLLDRSRLVVFPGDQHLLLVHPDLGGKSQRLFVLLPFLRRPGIGQQVKT